MSDRCPNCRSRNWNPLQGGFCTQCGDGMDDQLRQKYGMTSPTNPQPDEIERLSTEQQCSLFGCDLIDILRREGRHSGVWFGKHLLQAANLLERHALTNTTEGRG